MRMHDAEKPDTKQALLLAAGEMFAEYGFEGAKTRAIANKAGANIAAISYHFGGKEELYLETLRFVFTEDKTTWGSTLEWALRLTREGASIREALRIAVLKRLESQFGGERPVWRMKLMCRALLEPSSALEELSHDNFAPDYEKVMAVALQWNPALSAEAAALWANSLYGQEMVYSLAQKVLLEFEGWDEYPASYLSQVADHVARMMATALFPQQLEAGSSNE
jgi:TetR/AcrR family transcriptional regulator, regulator of cefoperazone and chloramphenicol sensitivity